MILQRRALVLNASYEPIHIVSARRAITLVMKGAALVEEASAYSIRTARLSIPIPSVVRLLVYRRMPRVNRAVSRRSIMLRDRHTCQYCQRLFAPKALTLDHVIPRSRGGASSWENLVAACYECNNRKADRTPAEAGMVLGRKPAAIGIHAKHRLMIGADDSVWNKYLFC
jgi:5-methylcytosine-specific restriction endonuclease McrA